MATSVNDRLLEAIKGRQQKRTEFHYGILTADRYVKTIQERIGLDSCYRIASTRQTSFDDVLRKASNTLVYSNPDMELEQVEYTRRGSSSVKNYDGLDLPKNTLMVFRHVLTTPRKDRDGDVLRTQGASVDPKMLLLWQHVHTMPIGRMLTIAEHNSKKLVLISCIVDLNEVSHDAAVMIDNGMGRFSHGFRALEFDEIKVPELGVESPGGFDVRKFEIMECSLVSVPSNVDAETEEVLLSLTEGGKLTSPIMRQIGKAIKDKRAQVIPVRLDLKVTVNGKGIGDEQARESEEEGRAGASEEANDIGQGATEVEGPKDTEVTEKEGNPYHDPFTGQFTLGAGPAGDSESGVDEDGGDETGQGASAAESLFDGLTLPDKFTDSMARQYTAKIAKTLESAGLHPFVSSENQDYRIGGMNGTSVGVRNWTVTDGDFPPPRLKVATPVGHVDMGISLWRGKNGIKAAAPPDDLSVQAVAKKVTAALAKEKADVVDVQLNGYGEYNIDLAVRLARRRGEETTEEGTKGVKPYPSEHACRLRSPAGFQDDSFRRMKRKHEGKEYSVIMGRLKGEDTMVDQAYRYSKDQWDVDDAKMHCKMHDGGLFEAAGEEKMLGGEKRGRVISGSNELRIREAMDSMDECLKMEDMSRAAKAIMREARQMLQEVLDSITVEEPSSIEGEGAPPKAPRTYTVSEAISTVLASATSKERKSLQDILQAVAEADRRNKLVSEYEALVG